MLAHLFLDEKFIDAARDSFERVAPGESRYFVLDPPAQLKFIRTFQPERVPVGRLLDPSFLASLSSFEVVFLHPLSDLARAVVAAAPSDVNFCWIGWGYDYCNLISTPEERILPLTATAIRSLDARHHPSRNLRQLIRKLMRALGRLPSLPARVRLDRLQREVAPGTEGEKAIFRKIRCFALLLLEEGESILRKHNLSFAVRSFTYSIQGTIDSFSSESGDHASDAVIVGNSATPESNHFDAFDHLASINYTGLVICPLSYGDTDYAKLVVREGTSRFGNRFKPLADFMSIKDYQSVVANARYLYVNHRRQQAVGNILMALYAGVTVIMRKDNPLFSALEMLGLPVIDTETFDPAIPHPPVNLDRVRSAIVSFFGHEGEFRRTAALIEACKSDRHVSAACDIASANPIAPQHP